MTFRPILPSDDPSLAALATAAVVAEGDARAALVEAASGANVARGEVVVWAWTFDPDLRRTLLVDHPRFGELLPPGGRVEPGEHARDAALRELREETGLDAALVDDRPALVDVVRGAAPDGTVFQTFGLAFVAIAEADTPLIGEPGQQPIWVPVDVRPPRARDRHWHRLVSYLESRRDGATPPGGGR